MPCPPSLEEQAQSRLDWALPKLQERLEAHVARLAVIRRVASALLLDDPEGELRKAQALAETFEASGALPVFAGPPAAFVNGWPDEEDIKRQEALETWLTGRVRDAELAACVLGCAVTRALRFYTPTAEQAQALAAHRAHRDEDRAARLATLEADLKRKPSPELAAAKARLEALTGPELYEVRSSVFLSTGAPAKSR